MQLVEVVGLATTTFLLVLSFKMVILVAFSYKNYKKKTKIYKKGKSFNPLVSILSPCYNEGLTLANCVKGLLNQTYSNIEVIIINDGSKDNTREVGMRLADKYPRLVKFLDKENGGKASALNYGLSHARGDITICIDADSIFQKDTVEQLVLPFADPGVVAVAGNVRISNTNNIITKNQSLEYISGQNLEKRTFSELNCIQVISGCIGAFRKDKLLEVGGYSSDTIVEDMDLTVTLAKHGYRIVYNPNAIAYTEAPANLKDFMKQRYRWCYGRYEVLKKHKDMLFKKEYGNIGTVGLPYFLITPWLDLSASVILALSLVIAILTRSLMYYMSSILVFTIPYVLLILYIIHIDGIKGQEKMPIYGVLQSIYYSYLLNYVNIKAWADHWRHVRVTWNKLSRLGANVIPLHKI